MKGSLEEGQTGSAVQQKEALQQLLTQARSCLATDEQFSDIVAQVAELEQQLRQGQFHLAVLGQFKRGKSTLINALLADHLLPVDILPVTAIPTFIRYAEQLSARVCFVDQDAVDFQASAENSLSDFLQKYVTEEGNPDNRYQVSRVEIGHPAALLQSGVVLIDTPGIGSTHIHNTEVAYQILPRCDAALFSVSVDPPITEAESGYLREIRRQLPTTFYLLNKIDLLSETDRPRARQFLSDQLTAVLEQTPDIFMLSARGGLAAALAGDSEGWQTSGMADLEEHLINFLAAQKNALLCASILRRLTNLLSSVEQQLELSLKALTLPQQELRARIARFRQALPDTEHEKQAAEDVLAGDLKRLEKHLRRELDQLREAAKEALLKPLEQHIQSIVDIEELERVIRNELQRSIADYFLPQIPRLSALLEKEARELLALQQQRSDNKIEAIRQNAAELFEVPYRAPSPAELPIHFSRPALSRELFISDMDPIAQRLSRKLFTVKFRRRRTIARLREQARILISQNVEQIGWSLRQGLEESFRLFNRRLVEQLDKTIAANSQAMELALQKNADQAEGVTAKELELTRMLSTVRALTARVADV